MRKILFYGDSNTYGYDPADFYGNRFPKRERWTTILQLFLGDEWEVVPEGMNGRQIPNLTYDAGWVLRLLERLSEEDIFSVMLGTNDLLLTMDPDAGEAIRKMQIFLDFLTENVTPSHILLIAPPYVGGSGVRDPLYRMFYEENRRMNEGFRLLAEPRGILFADAATWNIELAADWVHFSRYGHQQFAEELYRFLKDK